MSRRGFRDPTPCCKGTRFFSFIITQSVLCDVFQQWHITAGEKEFPNVLSASVDFCYSVCVTNGG